TLFRSGSALRVDVEDVRRLRHLAAVPAADRAAGEPACGLEEKRAEDGAGGALPHRGREVFRPRPRPRLDEGQRDLVRHRPPIAAAEPPPGPGGLALAP